MKPMRLIFETKIWGMIVLSRKGLLVAVIAILAGLSEAIAEDST
jgi:hypothetical protein